MAATYFVFYLKICFKLRFLSIYIFDFRFTNFIAVMVAYFVKPPGFRNRKIIKNKATFRNLRTFRKVAYFVKNIFVYFVNRVCIGTAYFVNSEIENRTK